MIWWCRPSVDYQVTCEPMDNGRSLRVTRRITHEDLRQAVVAKSVYDKTSDAPRFDADRGGRDDIRSSADTPRGNFIVGDGTELVAVLRDTLSTKEARDGDRMTLTVRSPSQYAGATVEGYLERVARSGQVSGRAGMSFAFDRIRLRDGRVYDFAGTLRASGRRTMTRSVWTTKARFRTKAVRLHVQWSALESGPRLGR